MKRVTITLEEDMYLKLLDYSRDRSKAELRNFSISETIRELLAMQMRRIGKTPTASTEEVSSRVADPGRPES